MLRLVSFFAIFGPVIGSFVFIGSWAVWSANSQSQSLIEIFNSLYLGIVSTLIFSIWGLLLAIPLGVIPASLSGLVLWATLKKFTQSSLTLSRRFLFGSLASLFVTTTLCFLYYLFSKNESFTYTWWFFAWSGTIAGGICSLFVTNKFYYQLFPERAINAA